MDPDRSGKPRIGIVGTASWLAQGLTAALAEGERWELVVMPGFDAADAYVLHAHDAADAKALSAALPAAAPVLWVGLTPDESLDGGPAEEARATACLPRDASAAQLRAALGAVLAGLSVRSPAAARWAPRSELTGAAAWRARMDPQPDTPAEALTDALTTRELEVFELIAKGLSNRDIAGVLGISAHTAKFHVAQILAKVGAATRAEAVALGLRFGLIGL